MVPLLSRIDWIALGFVAVQVVLLVRLAGNRWHNEKVTRANAHQKGGGLELMRLEEPEELGDSTSRVSEVRIKGSWIKAAVLLAVLVYVLVWVWLFFAPELSVR